MRRSRSFGHTSSSSLSGNTIVRDPRAATHWCGSDTGQPGASPSGLDTSIRSRCEWLLSARSNSAARSGAERCSVRSRTASTSTSLSAMSSAVATRVENSRRTTSVLIKRSRAKLPANCSMPSRAAKTEMIAENGSTITSVVATEASANPQPSVAGNNKRRDRDRDRDDHGQRHGRADDRDPHRALPLGTRRRRGPPG